MTNLTQSDPRTYAIIGAAMEVHRQLGCGFLGPVYQEALGMEFVTRSIPFSAQHKYTISYKGKVLESYYKPDFICFDSVVVELKASIEIKLSRRVADNQLSPSHSLSNRFASEFRLPQFGEASFHLVRRRPSRPLISLT